MWVKIGAFFGLLVLCVVAFAALKPAHYVVSRKIEIQASADKIFPHLNNSKLADAWGPWKEVDPKAVMTISGPEFGVGSKSSWESEGQLGTGSATIVESVPNQRVQIALEYTKPMQMSQVAEYIVESNGAKSTVTWKVEGNNSFPGRLMCLFMDMDKMVGDMFEKGLGNLKRIVETPVAGGTAAI